MANPFEKGVFKPRVEDVEALMARGLTEEQAKKMAETKLNKANARLSVERKIKKEAEQPRFKIDNPSAKERGLKLRRPESRERNQP